ncbi:hypothetical protein ACP6PL_25965 [Dapis sp. BLCC M126]
MVKLEYSYRDIASQLHLSKTTVSDIVKRHRMYKEQKDSDS